MRDMRVLLTALAATLAFAAPASAQSPNLVVNEIDYDQVGTDTAEFVEIRNNATTPVNLDPYDVVLVNGNGNAVYETADLPAVDVAAGGHYVVCGDQATVPECDLDFGANSDLIQNGSTRMRWRSSSAARSSMRCPTRVRCRATSRAPRERPPTTTPRRT